MDEDLKYFDSRNFQKEKKNVNITPNQTHSRVQSLVINEATNLNHVHIQILFYWCSDCLLFGQ